MIRFQKNPRFENTDVPECQDTVKLLKMMIDFRIPPYNFKNQSKLADLSQLIRFWKSGELLQQVVFNVVLYQGYSGE